MQTTVTAITCCWNPTRAFHSARHHRRRRSGYLDKMLPVLIFSSIAR